MLDINGSEITVGDIVKFHTICHWDGCSGLVSRLEEGYEPLVIVTMPDGETKMAFGKHEVETYQ